MDEASSAASDPDRLLCGTQEDSEYGTGGGAGACYIQYSTVTDGILLLLAHQ